MTPATHQTIWSAEPVRLARSVSVVEDSKLEWTDLAEAGDGWPGIDGLLDAFCDLADAQPEEMAAFLETWGVPELCVEHGQPDFHDEDAGYCSGVLEAGSLSVRHLRQAARGID